MDSPVAIGVNIVFNLYTIDFSVNYFTVSNIHKKCFSGNFPIASFFFSFFCTFASIMAILSAVPMP